MAKNEAKIKFTAETGEFNKSISKANDELSLLRAELKLNATQMSATGATVEGLERKHKLLSEQMEAAHDKTEALSNKLDKAVEIFGENSTEATKLRRQLANAAAEEEKIRQAVEQCNTELKEQQAVSKRVTTATEQLTNEIEAQQTELDQLKREYVDVVLEYGEASSKAKSLASRIEDLSGELNDNKKKLDDASDKADALEKSLDDAGDAAKEAGDKAEDSGGGWTILKDVIADMASDATSWAIESFKELMTAADNALATLGARTGATTGEMSAYNDVMQEIYRNNYGEGYDDIADAMGRVTQTLGDMDNASLQNVTQDVITLRDTFDMDYQESIRAANSLMDQFGLTSDEAFNLIAQGAQNGLNQNDDLLDTINEYSVQFKNAGYSADDMFNMLKNGTDSGTWSVDKLGDAVKEFNIRAKDGTVGDALKDYRKQLGFSNKEIKQLTKDMAAGGEKGQEAYKTILTALGDVDDETVRYQAGVALFGTMWEDLGENTVMALMNTQGEISKTKTAMDDVANVKYDTLSGALSGLGRIIQTDLIQPIADVLAPIAKDVVQWLIDHMDILAPIIAGVATAVGVLATALAIQGLIKGVTTAFSLLNTTMLANPIVLIVAAIAGLVAGFVYLWNTSEGFRNFWIGLWDTITSACSTAWEAIKNFFTGIPEWFNSNIVQPVTGFFSNLGETLSSAWETIKTTVTTKIEELKTWISNAWENIKTTASSAWENVKTTAGEKWENVKTALSDKAESIKSTLSSAWENVKTTASSAWESAKTTAGEKWESVKTTLSGKAESIKATLSAAWESVKTTASSAWDSAKTTAGAKWESVKTTLSSKANSIKSTLSNAWNSVKQTASNAWSSVKTTAGTKWESVKTTLSGKADSIKTALSNAWDSAKSTATTVWESIKSAITGPIEAAKTAVGNAIDAIKGFFNFEWSFPPLKMPHFSIQGSFSLNPPSVPYLAVEWYKEGGIMMNPTIFGMNGNRLMAGGEAGPEAILPIDKLEGYISNAVEKKMSVVNLQSLADAIENLADRPIAINLNGRQFALATASDSDSVNGLRSTFKSRGLALD